MVQINSQIIEKFWEGIEESSGIAQKNSQILENFHSSDRVMNNEENAARTNEQIYS